MTDDTFVPTGQNKRSVSSSPEKTKKQKIQEFDGGLMVRKKNVASFGIPKKKVKASKNITGKLKQKNVELRPMQKKSLKAPTPTHSDVVLAKKLWKEVSTANCAPKERKQFIATIHKSLKPKLKKLVFTREGAKVIQYLLKMSTLPVRRKIWDRLESELPLMARHKFASVCVQRMLKYGSSETHDMVIKSFARRVVKSMCHKVAGPVLELAYSEYATSPQKAALRQEFYGCKTKDANPGDIYRLADVFKATPGLRDTMLAITRLNILRVLNKKLVKSSLLHAVILDYLRTFPENSYKMLAQLRPFLLDLLVTNDGSRIAMMYIWQGSVKDRRSAIMRLKGKVKDIAMSEHGHWLLLAIFDCVDNTKLLKKILVPELLSDLNEIASSEYGRQIIIFLVGHRKSLYFQSAVVKILREGDTDKKSKEICALRKAELLKAVSDSLLDAIAAEPHFWLANNSITMLTLAILENGRGKCRRLAYKALLRYLSDPSNMLSSADQQCHAIEHSGVYFLLKKLIESDKGKDSPGSLKFIFASVIKPATIDWWINYNRACVILAMLLENCSEETKQKIKEKFSVTAKVTLESNNGDRAKMLLKKLV